MCNFVFDLSEIFDGIFPANYRKQLIVMLRAYFDGSKTFSRSSPFPCLAVAGFVGDKKRWSRFQKKWRDVRKTSGIDFFHMADYEARRPPYDSWSERKRKAVLDRLISLTRETADFGAITLLPKSEFDSLDKRTRNRFNDNPYLWCASYCIGLIARRLEREKINESVMYIFESGDQGEPEFKHAMARLVETSEAFRRRFRIYSIMPGLKHEIPALDSADFLAWETTRYVPIKVGAASGPMRDSVKRVLEVVPMETLYMDEAGVLSLIERNTPAYVAAMAKEFGLKPGKPQPKRPYRWE
jgi:hypothetical protein